MSPIDPSALTPASAAKTVRPTASPSGSSRPLLYRVAMAACISLGVIASTYIATAAMVKVKTRDQEIAVTGSATQRIRSDRIVWTAELRSRAATLEEAYKKLSEDVPKVKAFVLGKGIDPKAVVVESVSTKRIHAQDKNGRRIEETILAYELSQDISIRSPDVEKVEAVSREATDLIRQGIQIESKSPQYLYSKLSELKIEMLARASKDAHERAQRIAANTGARLGNLRAAHMGVMQINAADETQVSGTGVYDKTALEKDVMAVVSCRFSIAQQP